MTPDSLERLLGDNDIIRITLNKKVIWQFEDF